MNKKTKKQGLIALLILLAVVGLIYFGGFDKTLTVFSSSGAHNAVASIDVIGSDVYSETYRIKWTYTEIVGTKQACGSGVQPSLDYSFMLLVPATYPDNSYNGDIKARNVIVKGIGAQGTGQCELYPYNIVNETYSATCKYHDWAYGWECMIRIMGQAVDSNGNPISAMYYGIYEVSLIAEVLKNGVQCTSSQLSLCSTGQQCVNNQCVSPLISVYRFSNNQCNLISISSSEKTANDYGTLNECQAQIIDQPVKPQPTGWFSWIFKLNDIIQSFFDKIFSLSIAGETNVQPNTLHTYPINLSANLSDSNISDGFISWQYASWIILDRNNKTYLSGQWEDVNGSYIKNVTITTPPNVGDYVLWAMMTEKNATWNRSIGSWNYSEEYPVIREMKSIKTEYSITTPMKPVPSGWAKFLDWLKNFWDSIFG